jgi:hypothetical protein
MAMGPSTAENNMIELHGISSTSAVINGGYEILIFLLCLNFEILLFGFGFD